ncbi:BLUF domain-containing protein [Zobellia alginiliquefaciens]|uniref:BLUF domain-containing protein n=1 Tax=Zobellia alginiliquefaciens TaxID=3032586 RepID=UPI0023E3EF9C|nr:BLUF domain-containing protein [Zobellia alginiliquefaciens]
MYTLTYHSKAIDTLVQTDIEDILQVARSFNASQGITGCLIYYDDRFIQILEGPEMKVKELYENIKKDKRHDAVTLFSEDLIAERNFPDWGMAYFPVNEQNASEQEHEQFKRNLLLLAKLSTPTNVTAVLFWKRMRSLFAEREID